MYVCRHVPTLLLPPFLPSMCVNRSKIRLVSCSESHVLTFQINDLLQITMETKIEKEDGNEEVISDQQIAAYAADFLLAGYDTTSNLLSYTSYLLALHPEVQERLQSEIDGYLEDNSVSYTTITIML